MLGKSADAFLDDETYSLMQRVGMFQNPETEPYIERDTDLSVDEAIKLLSKAGVLSPRQAEAYVLRVVEALDRQTAAYRMGIEPTSLDDYLGDAREKVARAHFTNEAIGLLE